MLRILALLVIVFVALSNPDASAQVPKVDFHGDPLPQDAIARLGTTRFRHDGAVHNLRFSADGKTISAWSRDWFYVWHASNGRCLRRANLRGWLALQLKNNRLLLAKSAADKPQTWAYTDLTSLPPQPLPHVPNNMGALVFIEEAVEDNPKVDFHVMSPDGTMIASATRGSLQVPREIRLQHFEPNKAIDALEFLPMKWRTRFQVKSLRFSQDGSRLLATGDDQVTQHLMSCDLTTGRAKTFKIPDLAHLRSVSYDGKRFVLWQDQDLLVYDFHDSEPAQRLATPIDQPMLPTVAWSRDGKKIALGGQGNGIFLWDLDGDGSPDQSGQPDMLRRLFGAQRDFVTDVVFSPDGKSLVTSNNYNTISLWSLERNQLVNRKATSHEGMVHAGDISADGSIAVTCSRDGTARIWDATTGEQLTMLSKGREQPPSSCRISPDGSAVAIGNKSEVVLYGLETGEPGWSVRFPLGDNAWPNSLCFSRDGSRLAARYNQDLAVVWEPGGEGKLCEINPQEGKCYTVCLSPDGRQLAVASKTENAASTTVSLWDVDSQTRIKTLEPTKGNAYSLKFSPDTKQIIMSGHSTTEGWVGDNADISSPDFEDSLILWDVESGKVVRKYGWPECETKVRIAFGVDFSRDGNYLVTAERFGEILIYETESGKLLLTLPAHQRPALGVSVSADGQRLLSVSTDQTGLVWDFPSLLRRAQANQ